MIFGHYNRDINVYIVNISDHNAHLRNKRNFIQTRVILSVCINLNSVNLTYWYMWKKKEVKKKIRNLWILIEIRKFTIYFQWCFIIKGEKKELFLVAVIWEEKNRKTHISQELHVRWGRLFTRDFPCSCIICIPICYGKAVYK